MRKRVNTARFLFFYPMFRREHPMKAINSKCAIYLINSFFAVLLLVVPFGIQASSSFSSQEVVGYMNRDRVAAGLPALRLDAALSEAAAAKAHDMATKEYFAHTSPDGTTPWYFFERAGYVYRYAGENLAIHFSDAKDEETAWMASEKHRENILSPKYVETGIAVVEIPWNGKTTMLTVELFGTRFGESIADTSPWKPVVSGAPVVSGVSTLHEGNRSDSASRADNSNASSETQPALSQHLSQSSYQEGISSVSISLPLMSDVSVSTVVAGMLGLIGCLEIIAAIIVSRMFLRKNFLCSSHNTTPM